MAKRIPRHIPPAPPQVPIEIGSGRIIKRSSPISMDGDIMVFDNGADLDTVARDEFGTDCCCGGNLGCEDCCKSGANGECCFGIDRVNVTPTLNGYFMQFNVKRTWKDDGRIEEWTVELKQVAPTHLVYACGFEFKSQTDVWYTNSKFPNFNDHCQSTYDKERMDIPNNQMVGSCPGKLAWQILLIGAPCERLFQAIGGDQFSLKTKFEKARCSLGLPQECLVSDEQWSVVTDEGFWIDEVKFTLLGSISSFGGKCNTSCRRCA